MFEAIEAQSVYTVFGGIVDKTTARVSTIYQNIKTGKFFVRTEWTGYDLSAVSLAATYKAVRQFDTIDAVRTYLSAQTANAVNSGRFAI